MENMGLVLQSTLTLASSVIDFKVKAISVPVGIVMIFPPLIVFYLYNFLSLIHIYFLTISTYFSPLLAWVLKTKTILL